MAIGPFSGFLRAFTGRLGEHREEEARRVEHQMARDSRALELLATSDDPEIQNAALSGLAAMAYGKYEPTSGLAKFLGQPGGVNPDVARVFDLIRSGTELPALDVQWPKAPSAPRATIPAPVQGPAPAVAQAQAAQVTGPTPAAMAPPPSTGAGPTAQTVPSPGGAAAPSVGQLMAGPPPDLSTIGEQATVGRTSTTVPRQVFLPSDQRIRRDTLARERAEREAETEYLRTFMSDDEIKSYLMAKTRTAAGLGRPQSVAGEDAQGTPMFGVFVPSLRAYVDPDTGEPIPNFRPRTTTGSTSMGTDRDAISLLPAFGGVRYALNTPENRTRVDAELQRRIGETAYRRTMGGAEAEAERPFSVQEAFTNEQTLRTSLDRFTSAASQTLQLGRVITAAKAQIDANLVDGAPIGAQSQALISAFQRMIDELSAVRNEEYNRLPSQQAAFDRLTGWWTQITQGGAGLAKREIDNVVNMAEAIIEGRRAYVQGQIATTAAAAQARNMDLTRILTPEQMQLFREAGGVVAPSTDVQGPPPGAPGVGSFVGNEYTGAPESIRRSTDPATGQSIYLATLPNGQIVELVLQGGKYYVK